MQKQYAKLTLLFFVYRLLKQSTKYGMGQIYIQGHLNEACHQLCMLHRSNRDGF